MKKAHSQEKYTAKKKNHREKNSLSPIQDEEYYSNFPKIASHHQKSQLMKKKFMYGNKYNLQQFGGSNYYGDPDERQESKNVYKTYNNNAYNYNVPGQTEQAKWEKKKMKK